MKKHFFIRVREATRKDIPALVNLNRAAYPELVVENIVWSGKRLLNHLRVFPQGQLVAEVNGRIVGASSSLVVNLGSDPLRSHTWKGITDNGYFTSHDPRGDTLYGADVYVHPRARGRGVGHALYERRRRLCRRLNLRRILVGGRLWNYEEHADRMSPQEYARRVVAGEFRDLALSFQLREGFQLRRVMPNYLRDSKSHDHAGLMEWLNPDYRPCREGTRKVRVACVQYQMRKVTSFSEFARQVSRLVDVSAAYQSDFVLFPELFSVQLLSHLDALSPKKGIRKLAGYTPRFKKLISNLARKYNLTIIAGSHPELVGQKLLNVAHVCLPNGSIVEQSKLHITPSERKLWGITGGRSLVAIETPKAKIGILICYDVEFPEAARHLADEGVEILFVPFCTDNRQGYLRVRYCSQARAIENQIYVALAGNVGNLPGAFNMDVHYGRAAVFTPSDIAFAHDGIAAEADSNEETVLICDLDLDSLHETRSCGTVTPRIDRRTDLFQFTSLLSHLQQPQADTKECPLGDQLAFSGKKMFKGRSGTIPFAKGAPAIR